MVHGQRRMELRLPHAWLGNRDLTFWLAAGLVPMIATDTALPGAPKRDHVFAWHADLPKEWPLLPYSQMWPPWCYYYLSDLDSALWFAPLTSSSSLVSSSLVSSSPDHHPQYKSSSSPFSWQGCAWVNVMYGVFRAVPLRASFQQGLDSSPLPTPSSDFTMGCRLFLLLNKRGALVSVNRLARIRLHGFANSVDSFDLFRRGCNCCVPRSFIIPFVDVVIERKCDLGPATHSTIIDGMVHIILYFMSCPACSLRPFPGTPLFCLASVLCGCSSWDSGD